jgi:rhomboid protease GluP
MNESSEIVLRQDATREEVDEWALVLTSAGIGVHVRSQDRTLYITVASTDKDHAERVLERYAHENADARVKQPEVEAAALDPIAAALISTSIVCFYAVTGPRDPSVEWFRSGSALSRAITDGELWRTVTALTLHADAGHVFGNAVVGFLFFATVCGMLGPGLGLALIVVGGALGNLLNASFQLGAHNAVGASTAVFAAVGIVTALSVGRRQLLGFTRKRAWAPVAAGMGILAMLGASERSDIWSHLFGIAAGFAVGLPVSRVAGLRSRFLLQWTTGMAAVALLVAAWWRALQ